MSGRCWIGAASARRRSGSRNLRARPTRKSSPFATASFDAVLSTFGVMFTPNQEEAASELAPRVHPGGKIRLANWTPESFIGQLFETMGKYVPPAPGMKSPALWGNEAHLNTLFGAAGAVHAEKRHFVFRYKSAEHWLDIFRSYYGPVHKALRRHRTAGARCAERRTSTR